MMNAVHNLGHPSGISLNELRGLIESLCLGEQVIDILDAILLSMSEETLLERTVSLSVADDGIHRVMRKGVLLSIFGLVKYIVFHIFISSFIIFIVAFSSFTDEIVHYILLIFSHRINYGLKGHVFRILFHLFILLIFFSVRNSIIVNLPIRK